MTNSEKAIVVVFGLPGSGKTFFADKLAKRLTGTHISSDEVRNEMGQRGRYDLRSKEIIYTGMLNRTALELRRRSAVVLDATFYLERFRAQFISLAAQSHVPVYFIEIKAQESVIRERLQQRRPDSEADYAAYLQVKREFEPLAESHLVLHSDRMLALEMLNLAMAYIGHTNGKARG